MRWNNATGSTRENNEVGQRHRLEGMEENRGGVSRDNSVKGLHNLREIRWNVPSVAVVACVDV